MATTTTATPTRERDAKRSNRHPVRFIVGFLVTLLVLMMLPVPRYVITPVAMGVGIVADEPSVKRLLVAIVAVAVAMSVLYYWQRP
jgi:membrane protein DedA with SNARE-associated domain